MTANRVSAIPGSPSITVVDATAVPADRGGVGRYVDSLVHELGSDVVILCQPSDAATYAALSRGARVLPQHRPRTTIRRFIWEQLDLPKVARRAGADVIHSPHYTIPIFTRLPRVVTFHDATFFSDPDVHTPLKRWFFRTWIRISSRLARIVIVPSRSTADELGRYIRPPKRVVVAHHGVDTKVFHPPSDGERDAVSRSWGWGDRWIAFLGTLEPRKNLPALVRAYGLVSDALASHGESVPTLVLAGGDGWETSLSDEAAAIRPPGVVVMPGFLPTEHLRALLGGSELVVYPSLGEGFGLPILEAMASGAAVVTTRRLALPEVGGDAVAYSDVDDESIAQCILTLLGDPERRDRLRSAGLKRSIEFSWAASAARHRTAYKAAVS